MTDSRELQIARGLALLYDRLHLDDPDVELFAFMQTFHPDRAPRSPVEAAIWRAGWGPHGAKARAERRRRQAHPPAEPQP